MSLATHGAAAAAAVEGRPSLGEADALAETARGEFISARAPEPRVVVYLRVDGTRQIREGGSRSWRNNNPGNIVMGSFADSQGAIGEDTRFAIFPDEQTGFEAIVTLLQGRSYRDLTLERAIHRYAPPLENATSDYVRFVSDETGIPASSILRDLRRQQVRGISKAIQRMEGWRPGQVRDPQVLPQGLGQPVISAAEAADDWMDIALREASLPENQRSEWPDPEENPRILEYFRVASDWFDPGRGDETDWCASFVNYCLETAGFDGTGHPGARSFFWERKTLFVELEQPAYGCIAVLRDRPFDDPDWPEGSGHVGFVTDWDEDRVTLLGGNQGDTVKEKAYDRERRSGEQVTRKLVCLLMPKMN